MKIAIASPLFPPDIAEPASYVKELASKLAKDNTVELLLYSHLPELLPGVSYTVIEKSKATFLRVFLYTIALWHSCSKADVVLVQNGAATELPFIFVSLFRHKKLLLCLSDPKPLKVGKHNFIVRFIHTLACSVAYKILIPSSEEQKTSAKSTIVTFPIEKPEVLPFVPYPTEAFTLYESSWEKHLQQILTIV